MSLTNTAFADDTVLNTRSEQNLQDNMNMWEDTLRKKNMTVNSTKTKNNGNKQTGEIT